MRNCYIIVPGINTSTKNNFDWFVRLTEDLMRVGSGCPVAIEYRYTTGAIFRRLSQGKRAKEIKNLIEKWSENFNVVLIGHSNGCDLIQRALKITQAKVKNVHAFAGAAEDNIQKTGFYDALNSGRLEKLFVYHSKTDKALGLAARASRIFSFLGLGYGTLGLHGAVNVPNTLKDKVFNFSFDGYGHGTYFKEEYTKTLATILKLEGDLK
jgi:predicted alpha/beta hydrolase family esterase